MDKRDSLQKLLKRIRRGCLGWDNCVRAPLAKNIRLQFSRLVPIDPFCIEKIK